MRRALKTSRTVALAAVVAILLVAAVYIGVQQGVVTVPRSSSSSSSTTSTTTTLTSVTTSGNASPLSGLRLQLSVNASSTGASHSVIFQIVATERNTLATANNVTIADRWSLNGLSLGACGSEVYPFGLALYRGSYTSANASSATPLRIYPAVPCPMLIRFISGYLFQPTSDLAVVLPSGPGATPTPMSANVTATGEYAGGAGPSSSSTPLAPGTYTVAAGDEWGSVVLIPLTIGVGTSVVTVLKPGSLQAAFDVGPTQPVCRVNATTGAAPSQYSSIEAVITTQPSGQAQTLPISWLSNGCSVSGSLSASLAPGTYSLSLTSCPWMGCGSALPKSFTVVAGQSTTLKVSIDTGIR